MGAALKAFGQLTAVTLPEINQHLRSGRENARRTFDIFGEPMSSPSAQECISMSGLGPQSLRRAGGSSAGRWRFMSLRLDRIFLS